MLASRLFIFGILAVRFSSATPFAGLGLDEGDKPTPFRYTFRVEKVEFGSQALGDNEHDKSAYQIGTSDEYGVNYPDGDYVICDYGEDEDDNDDVHHESVENISLEEPEALRFLRRFEDLELCEEGEYGPENLEEQCVYVDPLKNVHIMNVLQEDEVDEAYKILKEIEIEKCDVESDDPLKGVSNGCVFIDDYGTIHLMKVFTEDEDDLEEEDVPPLIVDDNGNLIMIDDEGNVHVIEENYDQSDEQQDDQNDDQQEQHDDQQEQQDDQQEQQDDQQEQPADQQEQQDDHPQEEEQQQEEQEIPDDQHQDGDVFATEGPLVEKPPTHKVLHSFKDRYTRRSARSPQKASDILKKKLTSARRSQGKGLKKASKKGKHRQHKVDKRVPQHDVRKHGGQRTHNKKKHVPNKKYVK